MDADPPPRPPKRCRVCRAPDNDDLITVQLVQEGVSVATMLLELTGIQVTADKNLPQNVCLACLERLRSAHLLRRQCLESDELLRRELPVVPAVKEVQEEVPLREVATPPPQVVLEQPKEMFKLEIETLEIESEPEEEVVEDENELKFIVESVDEQEDDQTIDILTSEEHDQVKKPDFMYLSHYDESDYEIVFQGDHFDQIKFIVARCCGCPERFQSKTDLLEHGQLVHKQNQKPAKRNFPHECPVCFRQFSSKSAMAAHRNQIDTDRYHCRECDLLLDSQTRTVTHLERVHGIEELECDSEVEDNAVVVEDVPALTLAAFDPGQYELTRTEFGYDLVEFTCWRCCGCLASFELREDFEQHSREQHLPVRLPDDLERPYECNICYRRFEKRVSLVIHKNGPKKRRVVCRICEGIFRGETAYRKHAEQGHGMMASGGEDVQDVEFIEDVQEVSEDDEEEEEDDEEDTSPEKGGKYAKYSSSKQRKEMGRVPWNLLRTVEELDGYNVVEVLKERCCNCLQFFDSIEELNEHTQVHRQESEAEAACSSKPVKYQCEFCLKSFDIALVYVVHKRIREQKQFYQCRLCDFVIDSESRLKNHMLHNDQHAKFFNLLREDVSDRYYAAKLPGTRCCGCGQYFDGEESLEEHSRAEHPRDPVKEGTKRTHLCRICNKRFYSRPDALMHQKKNGSTERFYCKLCDFETANESRMLKHLYSSIHNEAFPAIEVKKIEIGFKKAGTIRYCCFDGCNLPFHDHQKLFDHVDEVHLAEKMHNLDSIENQTTGNRLQCDCCHLLFQTAKLLKHHQSDPNRREPKSFVCSVCGVAKPSKAALASHELRHTGIRPYPCPICDKRFSSTTILNSHMKCHAPKQYQCIECGEKFARNENLKRHIRHRHAEATFCCSYCPHKSKTREALNQHERSHTGEKPFECRSEGCQKRYGSICDRRRHEMASHTGERPHKCGHCTASFVRKRQLTIHERKHTGERPFMCLKCGKGFADSAKWKKHAC